jgi:hypothetical protein
LTERISAVRNYHGGPTYFLYVNGGLFAGSSGCPRFSSIAGFIPIRN